MAQCRDGFCFRFPLTCQWALMPQYTALKDQGARISATGETRNTGLAPKLLPWLRPGFIRSHMQLARPWRAGWPCKHSSAVRRVTQVVIDITAILVSPSMVDPGPAGRAGGQDLEDQESTRWGDMRSGFPTRPDSVNTPNFRLKEHGDLSSSGVFLIVLMQPRSEGNGTVAPCGTRVIVTGGDGVLGVPSTHSSC